MKALFITEGGKEFGYGHITRCLSVAQALKERGTGSAFIIRGDYNLNKIEFNSYSIEWLNQKETLIPFIKESDIVFLDSYYAGDDVISSVIEYAKIPVFIDDTRHLDYKKGIAIDWSIGAENYNNFNNQGVKFLSGCHYTALRKPFWNVEKKIIKTKVTDVLITMGGSDMKNLSALIIGSILKLKPAFKLSVIAGECFENLAEIRKYESENIEIIYDPGVTRIIDLMMKSDICISAGGQTLYELARIGTPAIAISIADNQKPEINNWEKAGFVDYAGDWNSSSAFDQVNIILQKLINSFELRKNMAESGKAKIDGLGAYRIADYILNHVIL